MAKTPRPEPTCQYPDEREIAALLLGKERAHRWPEIATIEERHGFPRVDPLYGGRYWPAVQAFYARRMKIAGEPVKVIADENQRDTFRDRSRKQR